MRMMMKVRVPVESGNRGIQDGSLPRVIQNALEQLKPEAAYFTAERGARTAYMFFDMKDASQMPVVAEPFFMGLNAEVELTPVMTPHDLRAGLEQLAKKPG